MKKDDIELLARIKKRFDESNSVNSEEISMMQSDIKFVREGGKAQWDDAAVNSRQQVGSERPILTVNRQLAYNNQVVNEMRQNRPGIRVRPCDDQSDKETAEVLQGVIRNIQAISKASQAYDIAAQNCVDGGIGYFRLINQYVSDDAWQQELIIKSVPDIATVRCGPYFELDGSDMKWAMIVEQMDKDAFEKQYKDDTKGWEMLENGMSNDGWVGKQTVMVAEYFEIKESPAILGQTQDGRTIYIDDATEQDVIVNQRKTIRKTVSWVKVGGDSILDQTELPISYIPLFPMIGNVYYADGKKKTFGLTRHGRSPSQLYNFAVSSEAELLALSPLAPFMADVEAIAGYETTYAQANKKPFSVLLYNSISATTGQPLPKPERQQLVSQSTGWIAAKEAAAADIQASLGIYDAAMGDSPNNQSGKAVLSLQKQASQGTYHYSANQALTIAHCGRVLVEWIPKIYTEAQVMRILGEDDEVSHISIDPNQPHASVESQDEAGEIKRIYNLSVGRYDVVCDVGPNYATKRQEAAESMLELIRSYPDIMPLAGDLLVNNLDWPGADKISERLKKMLPPPLQEKDDKPNPEAEQLNGQMEQMAGQMEEMGAHIKDLEAKTEIDRQKLEIEWFKAETARMAEIAKMEAGTQPGIEPTTMEIERHISDMADAEHRRELDILRTIHSMQPKEEMEQPEPSEQPHMQEIPSAEAQEPVQEPAEVESVEPIESQDQQPDKIDKLIEYLKQPQKVTLPDGRVIQIN